MPDPLDRLPWLPLDVGEYLAETAHLSTEEHGSYLLLIMAYWINGSLPADERSLSKISRTSLKKWKGMRDTISALFGGDFKSHPRLDAELKKARNIQTKRKIAGALGGSKASFNRALRAPPRAAIATANATASAPVLLQQNCRQSQSPIKTLLPLEQDAAREASADPQHGLARKPDALTRDELDAMHEQRRKAGT